MKVLYIVGGEGNRYGSEIIAIELISLGKTYGIEFTVVTANKGAVTKVCDDLDIPNYSVPFRFFVYKPHNNPLLNLGKKFLWRCRAEFLTHRAVHYIEKHINIKSFDIIHTNLSRDLIGGILSEKYNLPHVWHIHELFKAHYQLSFLKSKQVEWMSAHADMFVSISNTVADDWRRNGLPSNKITTIYNGIDLDSIVSKKEYGVNEKLKIVMVGHLVSSKGQDAVIKKLAHISDSIKQKIIFDCIGDGAEDYKKYLLHLSAEHKISFNLLGYNQNVGGILKDYDIGINCSRGEGFGLTTIEYMVAGLCPIVANTGANEEIIENQHNGFVFDFNDDYSLSSVVEYLYGHRDILESVSRSAQKDALAKYSVDRMAAEVFKLYHCLNK